MKRTLCIVFFGLMVFFAVSANKAQLFSYSLDQLNEELSQLQALEDYIKINPGITLTEIKADDSYLIKDLHLVDDDPELIEGEEKDPPLGIPSFIWGCVPGAVGGCMLGWVGILIVYLVTEDKQETTKALVGCLVGLALSYIGILGYYLVTMAFYYY